MTNKQPNEPPHSVPPFLDPASEDTDADLAEISLPPCPVQPWMPYYDQSRKCYVYESNPGHYIEIDSKSLEAQYAAKSDRLPVHLRDDFTKFLAYIQDRNSVHYVGPLAGRKAGLVVIGDERFLVTSQPKFIEPRHGDWSMLGGMLERMFGPHQLLFIYAWIKMALLMFTQQKWIAGHVLALCGPPRCGKNLFCEILGWLFGGREAGQPYEYMAGRTTFNSDFMGRELLTVHDKASLTHKQDRANLGAKIKDFAVNRVQWLHRKHCEARNVTVFQRLVFTLNDDPDCLLVLPGLDDHIKDKMMLMKLEFHPMPMPTTTPDEQEAFGEALRRQLPAFVHFLQTWAIPKEMVSDRFGVIHYHHPDLAEALVELTSESGLLRIIDENLFKPGDRKTSWRGKASKLVGALRENAPAHVVKQLDDLLKGPNSCGIFLGRLAKKHPHRIVSHRGRARSQEWEIRRNDDDLDDVEPPLSPAQVKARERIQAATKLLSRLQRSTSTPGD